jgi:hypothetical protein
VNPEDLEHWLKPSPLLSTDEHARLRQIERECRLRRQKREDPDRATDAVPLEAQRRAEEGMKSEQAEQRGT